MLGSSRIRALFAFYAVAVLATVGALLTGHIGAAHITAAVPFGLLVAAIAGTPRPRSRGWAVAIAGLVGLSLTTWSFASAKSDWAGEFGLVSGTAALTVALARAGGWQGLRRHPLLVGVFLGSAGLVLAGPLAWVIVMLHQARQPMPRGCADACAWAALGLLLSLLVLAVAIANILVATMTAVAFATHWRAGLGALTVLVAEDVLLFQAPPAATAAYFLGLPAWYLGLLAVTWPWIGPGYASSVRTGGDEAPVLTASASAP